VSSRGEQLLRLPATVRERASRYVASVTAYYFSQLLRLGARSGRKGYRQDLRGVRTSLLKQRGNRFVLRESHFARHPRRSLILDGHREGRLRAPSPPSQPEQNTRRGGIMESRLTRGDATRKQL
jgi:hypothetical protein